MGFIGVLRRRKSSDRPCGFYRSRMGRLGALHAEFIQHERPRVPPLPLYKSERVDAKPDRNIAVKAVVVDSWQVARRVRASCGITEARRRAAHWPRSLSPRITNTGTTS